MRAHRRKELSLTLDLSLLVGGAVGAVMAFGINNVWLSAIVIVLMIMTAFVGAGRLFLRSHPY